GCDIHKLTASFDDLGKPVRFRHLVFNQVLANLNDKLAEAHVVHVHVGGLQTVNKRMAGGLVASPRVLVPVACSSGLVGGHPSHVVIKEADEIGHPVDSKLSDDAVNG